MATTPVNIQFNAVGTQATIAQINAVTQAYQQAANLTLNTFQSNVQQAGASAQLSLAGIKQKASDLWDETQKLSFQMFLLQMTFQQLQGVGQAFYNIALKGNEELNQSILSTQSSLVAVTDVYKDGIKIPDSTEAIKAIEPQIRASIEAIRKDSLDLVGVTSDQLIPLFQILATNAGKITNQSKQWADPIEAAQKLTISFAASLGVLQIPLRQARQEIQSILQGYIDPNSIMAKQLGISNEMVKTWQKQGVLVDELQKRLEPMVAGNKLALETIGGMIPNIKEVIEEVMRVATEPIYEPIVAQLKGVYEWLTKNKEALTQGTLSFVEFLTGLAGMLKQAFEIAFELFSPVAEQIGNTLETLGTTAGEALIGFVSVISEAAIAIGFLLNVMTPFIAAFNAIMTILNDLGITRVVAITGAIVLMGMAVSGLMTGILGLVGLIIDIGVLLTGLAAGTVMTGGAFAGLSAAADKLSLSIAALNVNLRSMGVTMASIATAAAAAAVALGFLGAAWASLETDKLKYVNDSFDRETAESNKAFAEAMSLKMKLIEERKKALTDGVIDESEKASMESIKKQMEEKKVLVEQSIARQKELLKNANEDQRKAINESIADLEKNLPKINPIEIEVKMEGLESVGDAYKFIRDESERALNQLRENQFRSTDEADRVAKTAIANTKQEIDLGIISIEEARKRYAEITNFSYLSATTRIAAEKEITNITRLEGDRRKDNIEKQQQEIQELISKGKLSQITGEKEITEAQIRAASERLRITKELIAEQDAIAASHGGTGTSEAKRKLLLEQEKIEAEIAKARRDRIEQENKTRLTDYDEMSSSLERQKEQRLIGEGEYYRRSAELSFAKLDEQIRQTKAKLGELTKSDKEGREVLLAQIDDFEAKKAKIVNDSIERGNKIALTFFDQQTALLSQQREQRLIGEEDFYQRSVKVNTARLDEQIRQNKAQLDRLAKTDLEGRTVLLTQLADLETKKAKIINDADQRLLQQRVQAIRIANELLKIESEKANQILTTLIASAEDENKQIEIGNKALATKRSLIEAIAAVEKSYLDLVQASKTIELSNSERALDYNRKLQDEKIKGTELERVYQEELQKLGKYNKNELQLLKDKQEAEANLFNVKLASLLKEQELQKQLLELDLLREKSQLNQSVNQEKINVLKAQQSANEARGRTLDAEQKAKEAALAYQDAIKQGKTPGEIEEARVQMERLQIQLDGARMNEEIAQKSIGYAQQALGMAEDNLGLADILAQFRREVLRNKQNNEIQSMNEQGDRLGATQRIEQATLLTQKPELGSSRDTPTINRAGYTRYGIVQQGAEYEVGATGDRRLDGLFQGSQRDYRSRVTPSEADLINAETDRRLEIFNPPKPRKDLKEWTARGWDVSLSPEELEEIKRQKTGNIVFFNPTTAPDYPKGDSPDAQGLTPIPLEDFISKESGLPSPDILQTLLPQSNDQVIPNQINQIIGLISELKGGLAAIASTKTPVNPTINNNFNGPIDDTATMAKYRRATLEIIDNVIPKP